MYVILILNNNNL